MSFIRDQIAKTMNLASASSVATGRTNDVMFVGGEGNDTFLINGQENIVIDGKEYKKSETHKIADKILKKCNYNENKVKYNSNEGGLMFTNGLTIKEFEAKYGL